MQEMLARYLVPGDTVYISLGDRVPADVRLVEVCRILHFTYTVSLYVDTHWVYTTCTVTMYSVVMYTAFHVIGSHSVYFYSTHAFYSYHIKTHTHASLCLSNTDS